MPITAIASICFFVTDWDRAKRFYVDTLGLKLGACDDTAVYRVPNRLVLDDVLIVQHQVEVEPAEGSPACVPHSPSQVRPNSAAPNRNRDLASFEHRVGHVAHTDSETAVTTVGVPL